MLEGSHSAPTPPVGISDLLPPPIHGRGYRPTIETYPTEGLS